MRRRAFLAVGLVSAATAAGLNGCASGSGGRGSGDAGDADQVEVFSWWAGPGEKEGLDAMVADFKKKVPGVEFTNAAVAGGSGTTARAILADRLKNNDPPDSYQAHAGLELQGDVKAGNVEDLTFLYDREGWKDKLPNGLLDAITLDGKIYSVPVNIHRANLLWYNPKALARLGLAGPPSTWAELLSQAERLKAGKVTALSIGPAWTQKHVLESVLLGELGPDKYNGLWSGKTDWAGDDVRAAIDLFGKVLGVSDLATAAGDWQPALDKVIAGTAAYNVMGDWADAYLGRSKSLRFKIDYDVTTSPGSSGIYDFLSDSFTLPRGAPHRAAAEKWLIECGSVDGQDAFNPQKGSVPARSDIDKSKYTGYLATALADWQSPSTTVVGSLTHGVVANTSWNAAIDTALATFLQDRDAARFASAVAAGRSL
jgi:glucose/mannose transport system substrate-binding protein